MRNEWQMLYIRFFAAFAFNVLDDAWLLSYLVLVQSRSWRAASIKSNIIQLIFAYTRKSIYQICFVFSKILKITRILDHTRPSASCTMQIQFGIKQKPIPGSKKQHEDRHLTETDDDLAAWRAYLQYMKLTNLYMCVFVLLFAKPRGKFQYMTYVPP